jgi:hypothetical protein
MALATTHLRDDATIDLGPDDLIPAPELVREELVIVDPWYVSPSEVVVQRPRPRWAGIAATGRSLGSGAGRMLRSAGAALLALSRAAGCALLRAARRVRPLLGALMAALIGGVRRTTVAAHRLLGAVRRRRRLRLQAGAVQLRGVAARDRDVLAQIQRRLGGQTPAGVLLGHTRGRVVLVMSLEPQLDQSTLEEKPDTISSPPPRFEVAAV